MDWWLFLIVGVMALILGLTIARELPILKWMGALLIIGSLLLASIGTPSDDWLEVRLENDTRDPIHVQVFIASVLEIDTTLSPPQWAFDSDDVQKSYFKEDAITHDVKIAISLDSGAQVTAPGTYGIGDNLNIVINADKSITFFVDGKVVT